MKCENSKCLRMDSVPRETIARSLRDAGIKFPETATICQLKKLMVQVIGFYKDANASETGGEALDCSANVSDGDLSTGTVGTQAVSAASVDQFQNPVVSTAAVSIEADQICLVPEANGGVTENSVGSVATNKFTNNTTSTQLVTDSEQRSEFEYRESLNLNASMANDSQKSAHNGNVTEDDVEDYDQVEQWLTKRLRIMRLKKELQLLESQHATRNFTMNISDIEAAVPKFDGESNVDVKKWIADFECVTTVYECTNEDKFFFARRMLTGSAALFLKMSSVKTWDQLKEELLGEFYKPVSLKDIFNKLEKRTWRRNKESLHLYVLVMQEIARDASVVESDLVEYIIQGLGDRTSKASLFYNVSSIAEFKKIIPKYEKLMGDSKTVYTAGSGEVLPNMRCYNCSAFGHLAYNCTKEKRPRSSCFKCGRSDHQFRDCPSKAVATVMDNDKSAEHIDYRQMFQ